MEKIYKTFVNKKFFCISTEYKNFFRFYNHIHGKSSGDYFFCENVSQVYNFVKKNIKYINANEKDEEVKEKRNEKIKFMKIEEDEYFQSPFENMTYSEKENFCRNIFKGLEHLKKLGEGAYGKIYLYEPGIALKVEDCKNFRENTYKDDPQNFYSKNVFEAFIKKETEKISVLKPVIDEGLSPQIYELVFCEKENKCLTFMEEIKGRTVHEILYEFLHNSKSCISKVNQILEDLGSQKYDVYTIIPSETWGLIMSSVVEYDLQRSFLSFMKKILDAVKRVYFLISNTKFGEYSHGDLHTKNIMITYGNGNKKSLSIENFDPKNETQEIKLIDWHFFKITYYEKKTDIDLLISLLESYFTRSGIIDEVQKKFFLFYQDPVEYKTLYGDEDLDIEELLILNNEKEEE